MYKGQFLYKEWDKDKMPQETKQIEILASARQCYSAICDFASYPQWQKNITNVFILEQENSRPIIVEYELDVMIKKLSYTLRYTYSEQDPKQLKLSWVYVGGDLKDIQGSYTFEELSNNKTIATYSLNLELGFAVPSFVMNKMKSSAMKESMQGLKEHVEKKI